MINKKGMFLPEWMVLIIALIAIVVIGGTLWPSDNILTINGLNYSQSCLQHKVNLACGYDNSSPFKCISGTEKDGNCGSFGSVGEVITYSCYQPNYRTFSNEMIPLDSPIDCYTQKQKETYCSQFAGENINGRCFGGKPIW